MTRFDFRRLITRRKLESAGVVLVAVTGAVSIASRGPLAENTPQHAVAEMVGREIATSPVTARLAGQAPQVASGVEWDIPNLDHKQVDKWIARFTTGNMKSSLKVYIDRMDKYDEMIARKAEEKGMPKDLVYLAMIESGGNPTAKSPVKARGLWQFMSPTARQYGLKVAGGRDERIDPVKSTDAALEYLGDLHKRFGSWYLAAAAYNTGQGRVARIMKQETGRTKGTDADYYRIAPRLPQETRDYVPKMIAAARIAKEPAKYGFTVASAD